MSNTFWVIEAHAGVYWTGRTVRDFTDAMLDKRPIDDAVRFADQASAERVRCSLLTEDAQRLTRSVEHAWIPTPSAGESK